MLAHAELLKLEKEFWGNANFSMYPDLSLYSSTNDQLNEVKASLENLDIVQSHIRGFCDNIQKELENLEQIKITDSSDISQKLTELTRLRLQMRNFPGGGTISMGENNENYFSGVECEVEKAIAKTINQLKIAQVQEYFDQCGSTLLEYDEYLKTSERENELTVKLEKAKSILNSLTEPLKKFSKYEADQNISLASRQNFASLKPQLERAVTSLEKIIKELETEKIHEDLIKKTQEFTDWLNEISNGTEDQLFTESPKISSRTEELLEEIYEFIKSENLDQQKHSKFSAYWNQTIVTMRDNIFPKFVDQKLIDSIGQIMGRIAIRYSEKTVDNIRRQFDAAIYDYKQKKLRTEISLTEMDNLYFKLEELLNKTSQEFKLAKQLDKKRMDVENLKDKIKKMEEDIRKEQTDLESERSHLPSRQISKNSYKR